MAPQCGSGQSWASQDDYAGFNFAVILVGICVFSYLLWLFHHAQISATVMWAMHYEIRLIDVFSNRYQTADQQMAASAPSGVTLKDLYGILRAVGMFFRIPATGIIVLLAIACTVRAAPSRFKRQFDLDELIKEQASGFPVVSAFAQRHLKLSPPNADKLCPADYALTPAEWIVRRATDSSGSFNERKAEAALSAQLGERWTRPEDASPAARVMFTVLALHLAERGHDALRLLGDASACVADAKQDGENGPAEALRLSDKMMEEVDRFIEEEFEADEKTAALKITSRHAYVTTALMALLTACRIKAGIMAPAQFVWLKLVDRDLRYGLHSLGYEIEGIGRYIHPNPRIEALGARDHWAAERVAGRPLLKPNFAESMTTLRRTVKALETAGDA